MATGEDETVTVQPFWCGRIVAKATAAVKDRADFSTSKWKTKVPRAAGMNRVDREAACLSRGLG